MSYLSCVCSLEQPSLEILAMQLLIGFFTALLPNILPNDFFIPVTPYRADEITFRPKLATP